MGFKTEDLRENYESLASAVVGQACEEYCYTLRKLKKYGPGGSHENQTMYKNQLKIKKEIEEFFNNEINIYMDNPPDSKILIKQLTKVANDEENHKVIRFLKNHTKKEG